jgi:hypothetical protein
VLVEPARLGEKLAAAGKAERFALFTPDRRVHADGRENA